MRCWVIRDFVRSRGSQWCKFQLGVLHGDSQTYQLPITAQQEDMKWKKLLKVSGWCDKNGLNESFKMSPHLICLSWLYNSQIIFRPDPEAGHKRVLDPHSRHIKWGLISKLWMRAFSWQSWNPLSIFLPFQNLLPHCDWPPGGDDRHKSGFQGALLRF